MAVAPLEPAVALLALVLVLAAALELAAVPLGPAVACWRQRLHAWKRGGEEDREDTIHAYMHSQSQWVERR